jgi:glycolate oxidase FAD binding subunit
MQDTISPESAEAVAAALEAAAAESRPLEVLGLGSKRGLGRSSNLACALDLSRLSGITLYEPEELVLTAGAGTPMADIEKAIAKKKQILAFEPPDLGALLGGPPGRGSIGGVLACNLAGPRRIKAGAARDHFLGVTAVSGRAEVFKAGGRVMKNVTGYDLMKLLAGSYGTLAAMTSVTVKVLPRPEKCYSVLVFGLDAGAALGAMTHALGSPHEVSGAAYLPAAAAAGSAVDLVAQEKTSVTALRLEGPAPSVEHRTAALREELADLGPTEELHSANSDVLWREIRDVKTFQSDMERLLWRISVPPAEAPEVLSRLASGLPAMDYLLDWGGGLLWLALPPAPDAHEATVRGALADAGGHATLLRAPQATRAAVQIFQPQPPALAALTRRLKESFDPLHLLNPGRMYQEM